MNIKARPVGRVDYPGHAVPADMAAAKTAACSRSRPSVPPGMSDAPDCRVDPGNCTRTAPFQSSLS